MTEIACDCPEHPDCPDCPTYHHPRLQTELCKCGHAASDHPIKTCLAGWGRPGIEGCWCMKFRRTKT